MKKTISMILLIVLVLLMGSCDHHSKSFQALNRDEIPIEVTRDFNLPRGIYASFIWTTDSEVLVIIDGNKAIVNQKDEDVLVTLTATINKTSERFEILVLKISSERSWREKAEDALVEMKNLFTEIDQNHLKLPKQYEDLYINYYFDDTIGHYGYYEDNENFNISSGFNADNKNITIELSFYKNSNFTVKENYVYTGYLSLYAHKLKADDIYVKTLSEINVNEYHKSFKFNLELIVGDFIEFLEHDIYDVKLEFNNNNNIKKISNTKYQLVKPLDSNKYAKGYLTITINDMPKKILITVYEK